MMTHPPYFYLLPCLLLLWISDTSAQIQFEEVAEITPGLVYEIPIEKASPFLAYAFSWEKAQKPITIRFSKDGVNWTNWETLSIDSHAGPKRTTLAFTDQDQHYFQLQPTIVEPLGLQGHFISPGILRIDLATAPPIIGLRSEVCQCMQPDFVGRAGWCPNGDCPKDTTPEANTVSHIIVHHSAGTNVANNWDAIVRAIWSDHVNINRWDDIGYNWLIDPNGVIYEGRGYNNKGAHFCGMNTNTTGVCVLGNFQNRAPAEAAINSLNSFLTWRSCDANLNPADSLLLGNSEMVFQQISGHRDGCNTLCPGDQFYPMLDSIRFKVTDALEEICGVITSTQQEVFSPTFTIYPNPLPSHLFSIELISKYNSSEVTGVILNSMGQSIQQIEINPNQRQQTIQIGALPPGTYWLKIGHSMEKFIRSQD